MDDRHHPKGKNRGDWTPIELFVHAVEGWGDGTERLVMAA
jgi:hypothetical protein